VISVTAPKKSGADFGGEQSRFSDVQFTPMPLNRSREPFSSPDWIFKYDGFRALAEIEYGRCRLVSRNGNPFASFTDLAKNIAACIRDTKLTLLDGEIVCLDRKGRPQFRDCCSTVAIHAFLHSTCWFVTARMGG
jgi:ATP-dependent DNA ligase